MKVVAINHQEGTIQVSVGKYQGTRRLGVIKDEQGPILYWLKHITEPNSGSIGEEVVWTGLILDPEECNKALRKLEAAGWPLIYGIDTKTGEWFGKIPEGYTLAIDGFVWAKGDSMIAWCPGNDMAKAYGFNKSYRWGRIFEGVSLDKAIRKASADVAAPTPKQFLDQADMEVIEAHRLNTRYPAICIDQKIIAAVVGLVSVSGYKISKNPTSPDEKPLFHVRLRISAHGGNHDIATDGDVYYWISNGQLADLQCRPLTIIDQKAIREAIRLASDKLAGH